MALLNCWEYKKCGREIDGINIHELGVCPASIEARVNKLNHGVNAGRTCWAVSGTLCGGKVCGTFAVKLANCINNCDFYSLVEQEEGPYFQGTKSILSKLK